MNEIGYQLTAAEQLLEYRMVIRTRDRNAVDAIAADLGRDPALRGFEFAPSDE